MLLNKKNNMELAYETTAYVAGGPNFWFGMGMTVSVGMMVGATFYDGNLKRASKGMVLLISYAALLFFVIISRVWEQINLGRVTDYERAYAGVATLIVVSFFYLLGMYIGVCYLKHLKNSKKVSI